jgi:ABC-type uncharacterized transport system involved in gliding motility auxiliary subunit
LNPGVGGKTGGKRAMSFQNFKDSARNFDWVSIAPYLLIIGILSVFIALIAYLIRGTVDLFTYLPLLIGIVGILSFALLDPDRVQIWMGSRQRRFGTSVAIMSVAMAGIVVAVNYIVYQESNRTTLWVDLTENQSNTLSPETIRTLHTLTDPIQIRAYFSADNTTWDTNRALLDQYKAESFGKITYEKIDPNAQPVLAHQDGVTRDAVLVMALQNRTQLVTSSNEQGLTTAILRLMNPGEHKVLFLTGHGEATIDGSNDTDISQIVTSLRNKSYTVDTLNLTQEKAVPDGTKVLIIAGPKKPLQDFELTAIQDYLKKGGGLILVENPYFITQMDPSKDILALFLQKEYGITLQNDIVINLTSPYKMIPYTANYGQSAITQSIPLSMVSSFPTALSILLSPVAGKNLQQTTLVAIDAPNQQVWGETNITEVGSFTAISQSTTAQYTKDADHASPLNVMVSCEDYQTSTRVVVVGDEDFAENAFVRNGANSDLLLNTVDWASYQENLISLTPKDIAFRFISIPQQAWVLNAILLASICLLPGSFIVLGGFVWYNRRKHR